MSVDLHTALAILAMGLATYGTRLGGLYLLRFVNVQGRTRAALDALPPAILMAVIVPSVLTTGVAETAAAGITAVAAMLRLPMLVTIAVGVVSVVVLRGIL